MLKLVGLFSLATGALLHAVHGPVRVYEVQLFRQLWSQLTQGDVLLADRGFCSFGCLAALQQKGIDCVMRLHQAPPGRFAARQALGQSRSAAGVGQAQPLSPHAESRAVLQPCPTG